VVAECHSGQTAEVSLLEKATNFDDSPGGLNVKTGPEIEIKAGFAPPIPR
jgi:hypothetical protein